VSFCCAQDGCRRRHTPASVRFLGRKVYLGVIVVLITALQHGLTAPRRRRLIEALDVPPQTLWRWRRWWRERFVQSRCWRALAGQFIPPLLSAIPGTDHGFCRSADLASELAGRQPKGAESQSVEVAADRCGYKSPRWRLVVPSFRP
jgi:hypothetical protein